MSSSTPHDVLVIGEALIDIVERETGGAAPSAPVELVGGSPANVALGLARLGVGTTLLTHLAHDGRGERIARELRAEGVRLPEESFSARRTATARAVIGDDGSASYSFDITWDPAAPKQAGASVVHAGSLGLFLAPGADAVEEILVRAARDAVVSLDPNIRADLLPDHSGAVARFERLVRVADVVKLSDEDAAWLYPGRSLPDVAARIRAAGPRLVVLTLGAAGAWARAATAGADDGADVGADVEVRVPVRPGPVVDTISAGDSFMASILASVVERGLESCLASVGSVLTRAAAASAIAVSVAGANPPTRAALDAADPATAE